MTPWLFWSRLQKARSVRSGARWHTVLLELEGDFDLNPSCSHAETHHWHYHKEHESRWLKGEDSRLDELTGTSITMFVGIVTTEVVHYQKADRKEEDEQPGLDQLIRDLRNSISTTIINRDNRNVLRALVTHMKAVQTIQDSGALFLRPAMDMRKPEWTTMSSRIRRQCYCNKRSQGSQA